MKRVDAEVVRLPHDRRFQLEKRLNAEAIDIFEPLTFAVSIKNSGT